MSPVDDFDERTPAERRFAQVSRARFLAREARLQRERDERAQREAAQRRAMAADPVAAALARARAKRAPGE